MGSDVARRILGFLAIAYLARKVGVQEFGAVSVGFAVLSYAVMVSAFGMPFYGTRETARGSPKNLINAIVSLRLVAGCIAYVGVVIVCLLFVSRETAFLIIVFCLSLFPFSFLIEWYYQGKERMGFIGAGRMMSAVVYFGMIFLFVRSASDIVWVAIAAVAGDIIHAVYLWLMYRRVMQGEQFRFTLKGGRELLKSSFPLGYGSLIGGLSINVPQIALGILMTNHEVGLFSAASKLVLFLLMFDRVFGTLLLPASSRLQESSPALLTSTLTFSMKWILLLTLPICVGGTVLSGDIMLLVFGTQYADSALLFTVLIWFFMFTTLHTVYTSGLIAFGKEKIYAKVMLISGAIYLISIVGGILLFGVVGAAAAMVISEAATYFIMRKKYHEFSKIPLPGSLWSIIISTIVMGFCVIILPPIPVIFAIATGVAVYGVMIMLTKSITKEELVSLVRRV